MSFPVAAFFAADASEVPAGHYYLMTGNWYLSVDANQGQGGSMSAVQLTGDRTGVFHPSPSGVATFIGGDWKIEARVEGIDQTVDNSDGNWNAALLLGDTVYIYAQYGQREWFFDLDGAKTNGNGLSHSRRRFQNWQGWLVGPNGLDVGDGPLFKVQSIAEVG